MLGAYSQNALSGAALVNQVFFLIQQAAVVIGDGWLLLPRNIGDRNGWNQSGRLREWF